MDSFDITEEKELQDRVEKLGSILSGEKPIYLHLQFLIRNDHTDPLILKNTKVKYSGVKGSVIDSYILYTDPDLAL